MDFTAPPNICPDDSMRLGNMEVSEDNRLCENDTNHIEYHVEPNMEYSPTATSEMSQTPWIAKLAKALCWSGKIYAFIYGIFQKIFMGLLSIYHRDQHRGGGASKQASIWTY